MRVRDPGWPLITEQTLLNRSHRMLVAFEVASKVSVGIQRHRDWAMSYDRLNPIWSQPQLNH